MGTSKWMWRRSGHSCKKLTSPAVLTDWPEVTLSVDVFCLLSSATPEMGWRANRGSTVVEMEAMCGVNNVDSYPVRPIWLLLLLNVYLPATEMNTKPLSLCSFQGQLITLGPSYPRQTMNHSHRNRLSWYGFASFALSTSSSIMIQGITVSNPHNITSHQSLPLQRRRYGSWHGQRILWSYHGLCLLSRISWSQKSLERPAEGRAEASVQMGHLFSRTYCVHCWETSGYMVTPAGVPLDQEQGWEARMALVTTPSVSPVEHYASHSHKWRLFTVRSPGLQSTSPLAW